METRLEDLSSSVFVYALGRFTGRASVEFPTWQFTVGDQSQLFPPFSAFHSRLFGKFLVPIRTHSLQVAGSTTTIITPSPFKLVVDQRFLQWGCVIDRLQKARNSGGFDAAKKFRNN